MGMVWCECRQLTTKEVQGHLNDFGLDQEFGTFGKIAGLSGGQKVIRPHLQFTHMNSTHLAFARPLLITRRRPCSPLLPSSLCLIHDVR